MKNQLDKGDVLKSNPLEGFWVCSIVLSYQPENTQFDALSHIAITNAVFDHDFDFSEIRKERIRIIFDKNYEEAVVPCIGIYASKMNKAIEVVGHLDANYFYSDALKFEIGNGSDDGWPLCGPISKSLGYQAVHQWRSVNDREAWLADIAEAERSHKEMLERLKNS